MLFILIAFIFRVLKKCRCSLLKIYTYLSIHGEGASINVYMKSIGAVLDKDDPYTFTLTKYLKDSYHKDYKLKLKLK